LAQGVCFGYQISWPSNQWWLYFFPLLTIVVFAVGVSLFCDGLLPQDQR
jgi:ABC-type dipeptide/oligopeptide/nickel transport system permease subunit